MSLTIKYYLYPICSEHKTWFQPKSANVASYNNQVMATSRTADISAVDKSLDEVQFNAVRINIDEIERQQLITIFKASLKEKFLVFELDIQFLIIKVIMAVVDINKIFMDFNQTQNLNYFHVQVSRLEILACPHFSYNIRNYMVTMDWIDFLYRTT